MTFVRVWLRFWWLYWIAGCCALIVLSGLHGEPSHEWTRPTDAWVGNFWFGVLGLAAVALYGFFRMGFQVNSGEYDWQTEKYATRDATVAESLLVACCPLLLAGVIMAFTDTPVWLHGWITVGLGVGGPVVAVPTAVWWRERRKLAREGRAARQERIAALEQEALR